MSLLYKNFIKKLLTDRKPSLEMIENAYRHIYRWQGRFKAREFFLLQKHCRRVEANVWRQTANRKLALAAWLHDCEEVWLSDLPSFVKDLFPETRVLSIELRWEIFKQLRVAWPSDEDWQRIKMWDMLDSVTEKNYAIKHSLVLK